MKQLVQDYRSGELALDEVPPPLLREGGVLVRTHYSLVSAGTERGQVGFAKKSLMGKALARPDLARKVLEKVHTEGPVAAVEKALRRLDRPLALGYSLAGLVEDVASDVQDLAVGDFVACAGMGYASHAELVFVPRNLCVRIPDGVKPAEAAYVTLGAIALEGVRTAEVGLGENVVVIGLGLLGQLTVQLLKASGCHVLGVDVVPSKVDLALRLGADVAIARSSETLEGQVEAFTQGHGADAIIVTAASGSSDPLELAALVARDRASVTVVGLTGMQVPRKPFYEKALQLRMSRAYGPGRYDRSYEEKGNDYPIGYVRWTENRNMVQFLRLLAVRKVDVETLTTHSFDFSDALAAFDLVLGKRSEPHVGILLKYDPDLTLSRRVAVLPERGGSTAQAGVTARIGLVGAGAFAMGVLLPALVRTDAKLRGIAAQGGLSARRGARRFGFAYCAADPEELLDDNEIDALIVTTRPASHADLVSKALGRGKHVFVEKPLAVNLEQLRAVWETYRRTEASRVVMVGFNRRFSPFGKRCREFFAGHAQPLTMVYRVNAGPLEKGSWQLDKAQGGGRLVAEVGHFVDLMSFVCGERPVRVSALSASGEDVVLTIEFADRSVGTLAYVATGSPGFAKERLEVFGEGSVGVIDDFRRLELVRGGSRERARNLLRQDKGHRAEMVSFVGAVAGRSEVPSFEEAVLATLVTLQAGEALRQGVAQPVNLDLLG